MLWALKKWQNLRISSHVSCGATQNAVLGSEFYAYFEIFAEGCIFVIAMVATLEILFTDLDVSSMETSISYSVRWESIPCTRIVSYRIGKNQICDLGLYSHQLRTPLGFGHKVCKKAQVIVHNQLERKAYEACKSEKPTHLSSSISRTTRLSFRPSISLSSCSLRYTSLFTPLTKFRILPIVL